MRNEIVHNLNKNRFSPDKHLSIKIWHLMYVWAKIAASPRLGSIEANFSRSWHDLDRTFTLASVFRVAAEETLDTICLANLAVLVVVSKLLFNFSFLEDGSRWG